MDRLKVLSKYLIWVIIGYFFSNILITICLKGTYKEIKSQVLTDTSPKIELFETKATYINGYTEGRVTNNTGETIDNKFVKIDCYSARDVKLGTKYVRISDLKPNEVMDFKMGFKYTDVYRCNVSCVDEATNATEEEFISDNLTTTMILGGLIMLCLI